MSFSRYDWNLRNSASLTVLRPWVINVLEQPGFEPYASEDYPTAAAAEADAFVEDLVNLLLARATHNSTDAHSKGEEVEEAARFGFEAAP